MNRILKLVSLLAILSTMIGHTIPTTAQDTSEYPVITAENADQLAEIAVWGRGTIHDVEWSPKDDWIAVGGSRGVWLLDVHDLIAEPILLEGHTDIVTGVSFHPDGEFLASTSRDGTVRIWDLATFETVYIFEDATGRALAISPDGQYLAYSGDSPEDVWDDYVRVVDWQTRDEIFRNHGAEGIIMTVEFSADNQVLYIGSEWVLHGNWIFETIELATGEFEDVTIYPTRLNDLIPEALQVNILELELDMDFAPFVFEIAFTSKRHIATSPSQEWVGIQLLFGDWANRNSSLIIAEKETGHIIHRFNQPASLLTFSADSQTLLTIQNHTLYFWDVATGELSATYDGFSARVDVVEISPNNNLLLIQSQESIQLYDIATGQLQTEWIAHDYDFLPYANEIMIVQDQALFIYNLATLELLTTWNVPEGRMLHAFYFEDTHDAIVHRYSETEEQELWHLIETQDFGLKPYVIAEEIMMSSDINDFIGSVSLDNMGPLEFYDIQSGFLILMNADFNGVVVDLMARATQRIITVTKPSEYEPLNFTIDNARSWLAVTTGGWVGGRGYPVELVLQELHTDMMVSTNVYHLHEFEPDTQDGFDGMTNVHDMVFSPDSKLLVTTEGYELFPSYLMRRVHFQIWDIETKQKIIRYDLGHTQSITAVNFSPDGRLLATGSADGTVRLLAVAREE